MVKEDGKLTTADKGKGKATDEKAVDGEEKRDGGKGSQDAKLSINGKKGDEPQEGT